MLREQLPISHEFLPILKKIGLVGNDAAPSLVPFYYWTLFDADYHGTISLGAVYLLAVGDHFQLVDMEYYVSGNYYTSATLYEVWPVQARREVRGARVARRFFCRADAPVHEGNRADRLRRAHAAGHQERNPLHAG